MSTTKTEILYGIHPVSEAMAAGKRRILSIFLSSGKQTGWEAVIREEARLQSIPIVEMPRLDLNRLAGSPFTQGIASRVSTFQGEKLENLLEPGGSSGEPPFLLLADGVMDTGNLGALIRTGMCAGVTGIIIPKDRCAPPTPAVSRASAGGLEHIRLSRVTNLTDSIRWLKKMGVWVYGLDPTAKTSIFSIDFNGPVALVVGGEEKGIRPLVKRHCDAVISIPQKGKFNSLNVSVAGAVAMYAVFRQRMQCLQ